MKICQVHYLCLLVIAASQTIDKLQIQRLSLPFLKCQLNYINMANEQVNITSCQKIYKIGKGDNIVEKNLDIKNPYQCLLKCCNYGIKGLNNYAIEYCKSLNQQISYQNEHLFAKIIITNLCFFIVAFILMFIYFVFKQRINLRTVLRQFIKSQKTDKTGKTDKINKVIVESKWQNLSEDIIFDHQDCTICLEHECNTMINACKHVFHESCLRKWFRKKKQCPICKSKLTQILTKKCASCNKMAKQLNINSNYSSMQNPESCQNCMESLRKQIRT